MYIFIKVNFFGWFGNMSMFFIFMDLKYKKLLKYNIRNLNYIILY